MKTKKEIPLDAEIAMMAWESQLDYPFPYLSRWNAKERDTHFLEAQIEKITYGGREYYRD